MIVSKLDAGRCAQIRFSVSNRGANPGAVADQGPVVMIKGASLSRTANGVDLGKLIGTTTREWQKRKIRCKDSEKTKKRRA